MAAKHKAWKFEGIMVDTPKGAENFVSKKMITNYIKGSQVDAGIRITYLKVTEIIPSKDVKES